jgi:glutamate-1-semialdehyde 2,1-aminomutase
MARDLGTRVVHSVEADITDTGGVGGTLAGNALTLAAMRATLEHVLTDATFERMIALGKRFYDGVVDVITRHRVPWSVARLGARVEYLYTAPFPKTGTEGAETSDHLMDAFMHLFLTNRGILITPFHNMALCCPTTTAADVDLHTRLFEEAVLTIKAAASGAAVSPTAKL